MRSSVVTIAHQSVPWVNASALVPSGKVISEGICGAVAVVSVSRIANRAIKATNPTIMVIIRPVTRRRSNRRLAGSVNSSNGSDMTDPINDILVLTLGDTPPPRLDKALADVVPVGITLSRSRLAKLIEGGAVTDEAGTPVTVLKTKGIAGQVFHVRVPEPENYEEAKPQDLPLDIVFEDEHLIVVNKAADMVVHPAPGSPDATLVNALLFHCTDLSGVGGARRPGIVHRIDKGTSGILVVAKSDEAHQGLAKQFADHSIDRTYQAFAIGVPSKADPRLAGLPGVGFEDGGLIRIATNIARHKADRKRMAVTQHSGRHAITRIRVIKPFAENRASFVECKLETGRTHQIRVHMSHIGHGLIGDPIYGKMRRLGQSHLSPEDLTILQNFGRQALHAKSLGFVHPVTKKDCYFEAEMPNDMQEVSRILS